MTEESAGLHYNKKEYAKNLEIVGQFLSFSRSVIGLKSEDVALLTDVPLEWIKSAENGDVIPEYARELLVNFYRYIVGYNRIILGKKN